ncbi:MAG: ABC-2 type transport system permease protein [Planctomycetota bacterium]|jgi:ABC-2 type transport system permease protein
MLRGLWELTRVRLVLFLREPEALFWVFVFPLVLAGILGWAFSSGSAQSSRVGLLPGVGPAAELLAQQDGIELVAFETEENARRSLTSGGIDVLLGPGDPPLLILDAQRADSETARLRVLQALDPDPNPDGRVALELVQEKGSRYIDFLLPGLLGMNLMGTGMWSIGFAIADTRKRKLLRRMLVTPMGRLSFFMSFLLARLVFLVMEVALLILFGVFVLGVPLRGSAVLFGTLSILGAFTFAGLGILAASRAKTIEGVSGIINFVMMPMWLCSGVFFSYERFPEAAQPVLRLLPLTALNDGLRAVMLEGAGPMQVGTEMMILALWGAAAFALALRIFRWD